MNMIPDAVGMTGFLLGGFALLACRSVLRGLKWALVILVAAMLCRDFFMNNPNEMEQFVNFLLNA